MARRRKQLPAEPVEARVEDLDHEGRGVARVGGKVVFIAGALPGERVRARYRRIRGKFDEAEAVEILEPAPDRVAPACSHFANCGGCSLQHVAHAAQVRLKQARLLGALRGLGQVEPAAILEPLCAGPWGYRHKARLGVRHVPGKGGVLVGFRETHSNRIAEITGCEILAPAVGRRIGALRALLDGLDAREHIPQIEVAGGDGDTALVLRHLRPLGDRDLGRLADFARATGLQIWLQPGGPATVAPLAPQAPAPLAYALPDEDLELHFGPGDFTQVNPAINRALVARAMELLALESGHAVLDLFCGIGNFTLPMARRAGRVVGLEGEAALVEGARRNAARNALANVEFHALDLARPEGLAHWLHRPWDRLFLDPPRSGAPAVVEALAAPYPPRVVYVSCNPATLARDAGVLVRDHGYRLAAAGAVDMFPHTNHVESVALFERD